MKTRLRNILPCVAISLLALSAAAGAPARVARSTEGKPFLHPGIFYTQGDLDRMKAMVAAGREPWKRGFEALKAGKWANPGVWSRPRGGDIPAGKFNQTIGFDGRYAHDLALMWKLTGESAYGEKARDFLVNNSNYTSTSWNGTGPLDNGKIYLLIEAAELMRDYPGWKAEDRARFGAMLRKVFYPHIANGDIMRWGNQGLMAWHGVLAMAIFLDDRKMYDRVWNNVMGLPHRPDDDPYASGGVWKPEWPAKYGPFCMERTKPPAFGNEPDWGYDDQLRHYIYANGQCEESCRDQAHAQFGLFQMVSLAEIFWNQGDDLYGALDNRILTGLEWGLRYNKSDWEPTGFTNDEAAVTFENGLFYTARTRNARWTAFKPSNWGRGSDGGPAAPKTAALMHYAVRAGLPKAKMTGLLKIVAAGLKDGGCESWGFGANWYYEYEGWGTLTKYRTSYHHGDPGTWKEGVRVSGAHAVPGAIRAVDYDYNPLFESSASLRGRDGPHRANPPTALAHLKPADRFDYTLAAPTGGTYRVALVYRNLGTLAVSVNADGGKPCARKLPKTESWARQSLGALTLKPGAPVLRLTVDAAQAASVAGLVLTPGPAM